MQPSLREDYLEAIQQFTEKNTHPPRYEELAAKIGKPEKVIRLIWKIWFPAGMFSSCPVG